MGSVGMEWGTVWMIEAAMDSVRIVWVGKKTFVYFWVWILKSYYSMDWAWRLLIPGSILPSFTLPYPSLFRFYACHLSALLFFFILFLTLTPLLIQRIVWISTLTHSFSGQPHVPLRDRLAILALPWLTWLIMSPFSDCAFFLLCPVVHSIWHIFCILYLKMFNKLLLFKKENCFKLSCHLRS